MPYVIAFAGKIGSGKTTITTRLSEVLGWPRASFGDYVRKVVRERGLQEDRETLQRVGTDLLRADLDDFCRSVIGYSGWKLGQSLIIDGLRHAETIDVIQSATYPATFHIVFIEIDEELRLGRLEGREGSDPRYRAVVEGHSSEAQVTSLLEKRAELVVDGGKPIQQTINEIVRWLRTPDGV